MVPGSRAILELLLPALLLLLPLPLLLLLLLLRLLCGRVLLQGWPGGCCRLHTLRSHLLSCTCCTRGCLSVRHSIW
jgi:hypothetical protein